MFVRILIFLMLATPLMAVDYDTLFYGDIEDAKIKWTTADWDVYPETKRNYGGLGDLEILEKLRPEHLSAYSMTIEEKTVFGKWDNGNGGDCNSF